MNKTVCLPENITRDVRIMMFIDGENLAIRYKEMLANGRQPHNHVLHKPDVAVWTQHANMRNRYSVVRNYYYTSSPGDEQERESVLVALKDVGIQQPRVFHKPRSGRSKRVDITLCTDMLSHAHRKNYDLAVLVTGDEDYVPLVEAVASEGKIVVLWALESGLSKHLEHSVDHCFDLGEILFNDAGTVKARGFAPT